jgi:hypothetical protein
MEEEGGDYAHGGRDDDEEEDLILEDFDSLKRSRVAADDFELDDHDDEAPDPKKPHIFAVPAAPVAQAKRPGNHFVPFQEVPGCNVDAVRPEHAVVDNVYYYSQVSMWSLMYGNVTQGLSTPAIFDAKKQQMWGSVFYFSAISHRFYLRITTEIEFDF